MLQKCELFYVYSHENVIINKKQPKSMKNSTILVVLFILFESIRFRLI
ncbi:hypothetical protein LMxysn_2246 [Listeria monocytogenes]|nr:hypothetical protein LMxysn_2246 [Listeria monocytogenes]